MTSLSVVAAGGLQRVEPEGDAETAESRHLARLSVGVSVEDEQRVSAGSRQMSLESAGRVQRALRPAPALRGRPAAAD